VASRTGKDNGLLERADRLGRAVENALIVTTLSGMILLATAQILMRNLGAGSLSWADEALRLMVLWLAMVGAVAASREGRHISIDLASRMLPDISGQWVACVVHAFAAVVALIMAWHAWLFVKDAYLFQDELLGGLPAWPFQAVLPAAFLLIGYRYCIWLLRSIRALLPGAERA
jgi:TRAP-type C4-dicarboxylate transport system permease small subunit